MSSPNTLTSTTDMAWSHLFDGNLAAFKRWSSETRRRAEKAANASTTTVHRLSPTPTHPSQHTVLLQLCDDVKHSGFALYEWPETPADVAKTVSAFLRILSLQGMDSGVINEAGELALLQDLTGTPKGRFPPYQATAMNWHTDGYYNEKGKALRCFTLHCVEPATRGGALRLMDDTLLILAMLDDDPELVRLLAHPAAMTFPRSRDNLGHDRHERTVPMLYRHADGAIAARFTTRSRNIQWRCNATQAAAQRSRELIEKHSEWHIHVRLQRGQGIITRNILHAREPFFDTAGQAGRQMLRGRFRQLPAPANEEAASALSAEKDHVVRK